ncbi:hypothetical protein AB4305_28205 [Nocardia sp. 2YAB30]|uniref:hypothetical protein n=1 Tax=Nocardia sp. 2YAB30 TaxID=3233022 RepID=UPI003F9C95CC
MTEFQVDLDHLLAAANTWEDASNALSQGAAQARDIHDSHKEVMWSMFQKIWDAQVSAADYIQNRLIEGSSEAHSIGSVLKHVASIYLEKDQNFANALIKLHGGQ